VARLRSHVDVLATTIGERHVWRHSALMRAADYVSGELTACGYHPVRHAYETAGVAVANIETVLPGASMAEQIVVIGAHYDTVRGCPGANDNASGVAALLELAARFASRRHERTIRFVAFVNEEPPFFMTAHMGSLVYARACQARRDRIVAMMSLETIGYYTDVPRSQQYPAAIGRLYPDVGNFIGFVSNVRSARLLMQARRAFKARTPFPVQSAAVPAVIPGVGWSDHWSFWQAGYPAMMVTDTAPYRYPWYHTPDDTPDKISIDRLSEVVDGLEHVVTALAGGSAQA
jgi:Zn-dependent M28 family amino/carboxypeptidase